ncbi:hypothetical protein BJ912DRAFT_1023712 [Pholiota molesta]|nr:hypothetical protein BJ912DRAFT_1023712 [Pholiota molesta]
MDTTSIDDVPEKEGYLYAVLNLSKEASQTEINERHRSLSLIFHPDKQRVDDYKKEVASAEFLKVQKAYEVLSDPFLRYIQWPSYVRSKSKEEVYPEILDYHEVEVKRQNLKEYVLPKGKITCALDASPLFDQQDEDELDNANWISRAWQGFSNKQINDRTSISFESVASVQRSRASMLLLGTVRHQFSPRITSSATLGPFFPYMTRLEAQLFHSEPQRGKIILQVSKNPTISFQYHSPPTMKLEEGDALPQHSPPTSSGLKYMLLDKTIGITIDQIIPSLVAEIGLTLVELSVRFKCSVQLGFTGILLNLGAGWSNDTTEVGSVVTLSPAAAKLQLELRYLEQQLSLPISSLGTVVIPSCAAALGYHFIVIPRRRRRRLEFLRALKKELEEDSDARQRRTTVQEILRDPAKKQMRLETEREGLIIQEATYGAADADDATENISLDVTIPLQALVHNSQLHIPGGDSKAALQGFSDPAPFASKALRIRYLFHGRVHYAEIPDFLPVVFL